MLSVENENRPPKSDRLASSPCDGSSRERAEGAPTSDPPLPEEIPFHSFSIREYVFRSRSKDIYTNWPFSRKNLQLCLQHGVTEVLPPFQHLDNVKCQSFKESKVENRSLVGKDCFANFESVPSNSKPKVPTLPHSDCTAKLNLDGAASCEQVSPIQSPKDDMPLATTGFSRVSTETVPTITASPPASCKSGSLAQTAGKKCRLIVKFGAKSERNSGDDTVSNCTSFSENMASKVCPVCKTFSSSSNTTLNAHIDQCLSLESTPKTAGCRTVRHRIKPRKTRLMVDIYETAPRCTLEELNRRNGLTWANYSSLPALNTDMSSDGMRRPSSPTARAGEVGAAGAVYIDANGTKLRILSKFNDAPSELRSSKGVQLKKSSQGKKGSRIFKKKSKKLHGQKRYKYLKLASKSKKVHSHKANKSQLFADRKKPRRMQEGGEGSQGHSERSQGQLKPSVSDSLRQWASSKRTGLKKKFSVKEVENPERCQLHLAQDLLVENDDSSSVSRMTMRNLYPNSWDMSENSVYSKGFESAKKLSPNCRDFERELPSPCKRSLAWSDVTVDSVEKWGFPPGKRKLRNKNHSQDLNGLNIRNPPGYGKSQLRQKGVEICAVTDGDASAPGSSGGRQLQPRSFSRKALRFSTLRKRALSLCQSSENSSDVSMGRRDFSFKKSKGCLTGVADHMGEDHAQGRSFEEDCGFETSPSESCERGQIGLPEVAESSELHEKVQYMESRFNDVHETEPSGDAIEDCTWGLNKYYDPVQLNLSDCSGTHSRSQQFFGISKESLSGVEHDFQRACDACDGANEENADSKNDEAYGVGQSNSFMEIDPIPIPGPPGSFLPSPGAMGSDDFQGHSSLTTSQAQSSHDQQDLVDGDSSDSPVSATSTVSNSAEAKLATDYSDELVSGGPPLLPENPWRGFLSASNDGPSVQKAASTAPSSSTLIESNSDNVTGKKSSNMSIKKGPLFTRDGNEPCCCQKKERVLSQTGTLDYWEIQLPGRRRVPLMAVPGAARRMNQILSGGSRSYAGSEGLIPEIVKSLDPSSSKSSDEFLNGSDRVDCDFPSPSGSSNPVLRLMGKDLIVVNKEEDAAIPDRSQFSTPTTIKSHDSQFTAICGSPSRGGQNQDYRCKDTDYTPLPSFFTGSSSGYTGITMPTTVQAPKMLPVTNPKIASDFIPSMEVKYDRGFGPPSQFDPMKVKPVAPSKHMITKIPPPIIPCKEAIVIEGAPGKKSEPMSYISDSGNFPRDAVSLPRALANGSGGAGALPTTYQPRGPITLREPVVGVVGGYPKGAGFSNGKLGDDADSRLLQRAPPFAATPPFLGHPGSGFVYYPSFS